MSDPEKKRPEYPEPIPRLSKRRLWFSAGLLAVMAVTAFVAVGVGYSLVHDADAEPAPLGTVALVVSPALTLIGTLAPVLANLLRDENH